MLAEMMQMLISTPGTMLNLLLALAGIAALLAASYSDLKYKEVPDWLNYGLIISAFGLRAIFSLKLGWNCLLSGILGFAACLLLGLILYYTRQWGGGDSKLMMGLGAVIGVSYPWHPENLASWSLVLFFLAALFLGAIYGLFYLVYLAARNQNNFSKLFLSKIRESKRLQLVLAIITLLLLGLCFWSILFLPLLFLPLGFFYLFTFVSSVEQSCFFQKREINQLTEGDWLAEEVVLGRKIYLPQKTLERKDLWKLRELQSAGKLQKVLIKEGIPFVPGFLLAYLALLFLPQLFEWVLAVF